MKVSQKNQARNPSHNFSWELCNWTAYYGSTGCLVFKQGVYTKIERFLPKNQQTLRKFLNFENWCKAKLF